MSQLMKLLDGQTTEQPSFAQAMRSTHAEPTTEATLARLEEDRRAKDRLKIRADMLHEEVNRTLDRDIGADAKILLVTQAIDRTITALGGDPTHVVEGDIAAQVTDTTGSDTLAALIDLGGNRLSDLAKSASSNAATTKDKLVALLTEMLATARGVKVASPAAFHQPAAAKEELSPDAALSHVLENLKHDVPGSPTADRSDSLASVLGK